MFAAQPTALQDAALLRQQIRKRHAELQLAAATSLQASHTSTPWSRTVRLYLHALCVEDITIQSVLRKDAPLFLSLWPQPGGPSDSTELRQYARAVYAATDAYMCELNSNRLHQIVDLDQPGVGQRTAAWVIHRFVVLELARICSEMSGPG